MFTTRNWLIKPKFESICVHGSNNECWPHFLVTCVLPFCEGCTNFCELVKHKRPFWKTCLHGKRMLKLDYFKTKINFQLTLNVHIFSIESKVVLVLIKHIPIKCMFIKVHYQMLWVPCPSVWYLWLHCKGHWKRKSFCNTLVNMAHECQIINLT